MGRFGLAVVALAFAVPLHAQDDPGPIAVHGNKQTIEIARCCWPPTSSIPARRR
jgi:hypothetical protein